ncbi:MAG: hypothetical protein MR014_10315 [Oscillospiraceae bacterium]|nr:hypothetical protein [Oscillospiraceae bacterium]
MKMCRTWIKTLALVLVLALGLAGCGANQKALVGTWEVADEEGAPTEWGCALIKMEAFIFPGPSVQRAKRTWKKLLRP